LYLLVILILVLLFYFKKLIGYIVNRLCSISCPFNDSIKILDSAGKTRLTIPTIRSKIIEIPNNFEDPDLMERMLKVAAEVVKIIQDKIHYSPNFPHRNVDSEMASSEFDMMARTYLNKDFR
jgi:hypothetical protein